MGGAGYLQCADFSAGAGANAPYDDMAGLAAYAKDNDVSLGHFGAPLIPTKVTLALARGKKTYDKRHALAERDSKREVERAMKHKR